MYCSVAPALSWIFCHVPLTGTTSTKYLLLVTCRLQASHLTVKDQVYRSWNKLKYTIFESSHIFIYSMEMDISEINVCQSYD